MIVKKQIETNAYLEGRNAGYQCDSSSLSKPKNRYPPNTMEFLEWEDGFFDGKNSNQTYFLQNTSIERFGCRCHCSSASRRH